MFDPAELPESRSDWRNRPGRDSVAGVEGSSPGYIGWPGQLEDGLVVDEMQFCDEPPHSESSSRGVGMGDSQEIGCDAGGFSGCRSVESGDRYGGPSDSEVWEQGWVIESAIGVSTGGLGAPDQSVPLATGQPVAGLRSVKQDWVGGRSSSEPCPDVNAGPDSDSDSVSVSAPALGTGVGPGSDALAGDGARSRTLVGASALAGAGSRPGVDSANLVVSLGEELLVVELHRLWLAQRPDWVDPCWYDAHIRPRVRALLLLSPGPELLTALSRVTVGPCPADHDGEGFPLFPTLGSKPGFACDCQLVVAAAWQACESWVQAQATRNLVDVMGRDPIVIPGDGVAPGTVDPGREEAALMLRHNLRSFANRVDTARGIAAHQDLVELAESGACSFWTVRLLASDLANLTDEQAQKVTGELVDKVIERIQVGARPWTGAQIRAAAKRLIARLCPKNQAATRARAWKGRRVQVWPRDHGMSVLAATISATDAHRILRRLTQQAADLSDPERTRDQKRADILADSLLTSPTLQPPDAESESQNSSSSRSFPGPVDDSADAVRSDRADTTTTNGDGGSRDGGSRGGGDRDGGGGGVESIVPAISSRQESDRVVDDQSGSANTPSQSSRCSPASATAASFVPESGTGTAAEVCVVVELETLLGLVDDSAEMLGVGPITADIARELAADGKWRAWITNSAGTITATSSQTYRPSAALARLVRAREPYCRMPGCRTPASRCDLDHAIAWPEGETTIENLGPLCRRHHIMKTHYGWRLEPKPGPALATTPRRGASPVPGAVPGRGAWLVPGAVPGRGASPVLGAVPRPRPGAEQDSPESELPASGSTAQRSTTDPWRDGVPAPDPWCRPPGWSWETPNGKTIEGGPPPPF
jgi:hypothetical protein